MERSGCLEKEIPRSAMFPVDTPPTLLDCGNLSYIKKHPSEHGDDARKKGRTSAASWPPAPMIMSSAACTTCKENPNGFLYVASVCWELAKGSNASLCSVMITSRSDIVMELIIFDKLSVIRNIFDTKKTDSVNLSWECDFQNKGLKGAA
jgi:hypothetical protein